VRRVRMLCAVHPRRAAFFDLDKTVIARSSTAVFGRPFYRGGLITRRQMLRTGVVHLMYHTFGADRSQLDRMREYFASLVTGWDVEQARRVIDETLTELVEPMVYAEAVELIAGHRAAGRDVVLVSSSGVELVEPIGQLLGVDRVIATRMSIADGRYTGEVEFYAFGETKAAAARELAAREGYDLADSFAYSDSHTDIPLLEAVGNAVAVNPDRALRRVALERGWTVLRFERPTALRAKLSPTGAMLIGAAAGVAAAGVVYWVRQRRRSAA
jgi:HAD superfamily hydrolase (TIGR01490 family)